LSFVVLLTGAFTALSMGLIGIVQNDQRVIAYSTLSQLGYDCGIGCLLPIPRAIIS
jgi:NADH:ubiquinone oxidoreductase subunit 5 (subunit L)/multisubunit Na+/H+ antiporter MnhA subunit